MEHGNYGMVGQSKPMLELYKTIGKVAPTNATILIKGERGTGKELVAKAIYENSKGGGDCVIVNCAAIPKELLESELFGYERGAFTGAYKDKKGKIEMADNGTLFLDEIADLPLEQQAKLLRVLEYKGFERIGSNDTLHSDFRLITATNKDLEGLIQEKKFRDDLYDRINVISIDIPPLRERREDIPLLTDYFIQQLNGKKEIEEGAMHMLVSYNWPGNVRQLKSVVECLVVMSDGDKITPKEVTNYSKFPIYGHQQNINTVLNTAMLDDTRIYDLYKNMLNDTRIYDLYSRSRIEGIAGVSKGYFTYSITKSRIVPSFVNGKQKLNIRQAMEYCLSTGNFKAIENINKFLETGKTLQERARVEFLPDGHVITVREAARISNIPHGSIYCQIKKGELPYKTSGESYLILLEDLINYAEKRKESQAVERMQKFIEEQG